MNDEVLVRVEGVGKKFCRDLKKSLWYGMKDIAAELLPGERDLERHAILRPGEFWAVDDVSFDLRRGESLGLIGRNGAGKTTLLKMLNGLIKPDKGRIEIRGRVGALIALGAGFNPILTGRENIYVNGSVLGSTKQEIDGKLEEIIEFAEMGEFIDAPVQSYSSGMNIRLGFAIATAFNSDVLLLDEILAVGDTRFRMKCFEKIQQKLRDGCAAVLVSHNVVDIMRTCNLGVHIDRGETRHIGDIESVIESYQSQTQSRSDVQEMDGSQHVEYFHLCAQDQDGGSISNLRTGDGVTLAARLKLASRIEAGRMNLHIDSPLGLISSSSSLLALPSVELSNTTSEIEISIRLERLPLLNGIYTFWLDLYGPELKDFYAKSTAIQLNFHFDKYDMNGNGACHIFLPSQEWSVRNNLPPVNFPVINWGGRFL